MNEKVTKFTRLRDWLERNKVFFELTTAILLSIMSLTVSINANHIAEYQAELMKEQNNLTKYQNQPIFEFKLVELNSSTLNTAEKIDIYNNRTAITNFKAEAYVLCDVYLSNYSYAEIGLSDIVLSFTQNCYYDVIPTGSSQGLMSSVESTGFLSSLPRYLNSTSSSAELNSYLQNQSNIKQVKLTRYIHVTYSDIYGENHDEVYWVTEIGTFKITEDKKMELANKLGHAYLIAIPVSSSDSMDNWRCRKLL
jgi:hypothetical protein